MKKTFDPCREYGRRRKIRNSIRRQREAVYLLFVTLFHLLLYFGIRSRYTSSFEQQRAFIRTTTIRQQLSYGHVIRQTCTPIGGIGHHDRIRQLRHNTAAISRFQFEEIADSSDSNKNINKKINNNSNNLSAFCLSKQKLESLNEVFENSMIMKNDTPSNIQSKQYNSRIFENVFSRRNLLITVAAVATVPTSLLAINRNDDYDSTMFAYAASEEKTASSTTSNNSSLQTFRSKVYGQQEYTNSITASKDTNVSPAEAYDIIRQQIPNQEEMIQRKKKYSMVDADQSSRKNNDVIRVIDVGAGAGLSTQVLYIEKGYQTIDAIDWSKLAWDESIIEQPSSVQFYELDDDSFFSSIKQKQQKVQGRTDTDLIENNNKSTKYDVIVYNFAINLDKARKVAMEHLIPGSGILLAPCNDKVDYWYKQTYYVLNQKGDILWKSLPDVGAWSVQFQPDVTSSTCTGIWCGGFNGFQQKVAAR